MQAHRSFSASSSAWAFGRSASENGPHRVQTSAGVDACAGACVGVNVGIGVCAAPCAGAAAGECDGDCWVEPGTCPALCTWASARAATGLRSRPRAATCCGVSSLMLSGWTCPASLAGSLTDARSRRT